MFIWLAVFAVTSLCQSQVRPAVADFARVLWVPSIRWVLAATIATGAALVLAGRRLSLWSPDLLTETLVWFVGTALVMVVSSTEFPRLRKLTAMVQVVAATALTGVLVNLFVFPLAVELILVPLATMLAMVAVVADHAPAHAASKRVAEGALAIIGVTVVGYVGARLLFDWAALDLAAEARRAALPVWLTIGFLPFAYALSVWMAYDSAWRRMMAVPGDPRARARGFLGLVTAVRLRVRILSGFTPHWGQRITRTSTLAAARCEATAFIEQSARKRRSGNRQPRQKA